jgi:hypothetical protein
MENAEKVHENKLRRMAKRQGCELVKSRRRDPRAIDFGTYQLVPAKGKPLGPFTLDEVEARLTR